jgi:hypothetical protein
MQVFVLNPLKFPESVTDTIEILVEYSVSGDSEWQIPNGKTLIHTSTFPIPPSAKKLVAQSGFSQRCSVQPLKMFSTTMDCEPGIEPASLSMSERIMSIRQLLKQGGFCAVMKCDQTIYNYIQPWAIQVWRADDDLAGDPLVALWGDVAGSLSDKVDRYNYCDNISQFAPWYRFHRGGMRLSFGPEANAPIFAWPIYSEIDWKNDDNVPKTFTATGAPDGIQPGPVSTWVQITNNISTGTCAVPQKSNYPLRICSDMAPFENLSGGISTTTSDDYTSVQVWPSVSQTTSPVIVERYADEDFELLWFIGVQPWVQTRCLDWECFNNFNVPPPARVTEPLRSGSQVTQASFPCLDGMALALPKRANVKTHP